MGTNVFFHEVENQSSADPNFELVPEKMFDIFCKTNKILKMNRIFVEERETDADHQTHATDDPTVLLTKSYGNTLNQFLKPGEEPPRQLDADEAFFRKYGERGDESTPPPTADRADMLRKELEKARIEFDEN